MEFFTILSSLPHSILLWKLLAIFFASLCFYLFPASWAYWVNQRQVEKNINQIFNDIKIVEENEKKLINLLDQFSVSSESQKELLKEFILLRENFNSHNNKLEAFIDKIEFMISIKSNLSEDDDIFKVINKLQQKKRKIDRY